ncbi:hypothetical protein QYE80_13485 [Pseudomonas tohonis]|uniref:hypothetical protein n=1 Tax=Pseudomonas sp. zfem005 TaxID=3078200 RepID=UPI00146B9058|nr:hypothetical protein [Pseudomonas sp. zfem005]MDN4146001.1 hypothetical protein [Pseudomonas tohonis]MDU9415335.1 hypothetical protein [Pseudomonas sp. zfem005]
MTTDIENLHCPVCDWLEDLEGDDWVEACQLIATWRKEKDEREAKETQVVHVRSDDLRAVYRAVIDADEEGLAGHAEPMIRIAAALPQP